MDTHKKKLTESSIEDKLLEKLNEYGESIIGAVYTDKKKKGKRKENSSAENISNAQIPSFDKTESTPASNKRKKKRKQKKKNNMTSDDDEMVLDCDNSTEFITEGLPQVSGKEKQLELMKAELGLTSFKTEIERKKKKEEEERARLKKEINKKEPEVIVFHSRKPKKSKETTQARADGAGTDDDGPEFDLKQARFDVRKFGIKGFQGNKKEEAMTALLMHLGAKTLSHMQESDSSLKGQSHTGKLKPPKNKFVNYKDYQKQKKREIRKEVERNEQLRREGYKIPNKKKDQDRKRRKDKNDIGFIDGQVGRYKGGVQVVNPDLIGGGKKAKINKR